MVSLDFLLVTHCRLSYLTEGLGSFVVIRNTPYSEYSRTDNGHVRDVYIHTDLCINWFSVFSAGEIADVPDRPARKCQLLRMLLGMLTQSRKSTRNGYTYGYTRRIR